MRHTAQQRLRCHFDTRHRTWEKTDEKTPYEFHDTRKLMAESTRIPEPPSTPWLRIAIGPEFGGSDTTFDQAYLDSRGNSVDGVRAQVQTRWADRSIVAMLHYRNNDNESYGPTAPNTSRTRTDFLGGELGIRFSHERWWSPFVRFGFGREHQKLTFTTLASPTVAPSVSSFIPSPRPSASTLSSRRGAFVGSHFIRLPNSLTQSLTRGAKENLNANSVNSSPTGDFTNEPWSVSTFGLLVHLGLMLQFY